MPVLQIPGAKNNLGAKFCRKFGPGGVFVLQNFSQVGI